MPDTGPVTVHGLSPERRYTLLAASPGEPCTAWARFVSPRIDEIEREVRTTRCFQGRVEAPRGSQTEVLWTVGAVAADVVDVVAWIGEREDPIPRGATRAAPDGANVLHFEYAPR